MAFDSNTYSYSTVNAAAIVQAAMALCGVHGQRYGRMSNPKEGLDCIGLIERVSAAVGAPVLIDRDWQDNGGELPLVSIPVDLAEPGDVLVFDLGPNCRAFHRYQLGILAEGLTTDPRAKFVGVPHAVSLCWLNAGVWANNLVRAYRLGVVFSGSQGDMLFATQQELRTGKSSSAPSDSGEGSDAPHGLSVRQEIAPSKPKRLTKAMKRLLRANAEAAVERLIALMDELDGDSDLEDNADREAVCEDEGAQCDDEGANSDDEPNADDQDATWIVTPYAEDQTGAKWCRGDSNFPVF